MKRNACAMSEKWRHHSTQKLLPLFPHQVRLLWSAGERARERERVHVSGVVNAQVCICIIHTIWFSFTASRWVCKKWFNIMSPLLLLLLLLLMVWLVLIFLFLLNFYHLKIFLCFFSCFLFFLLRLLLLLLFLHHIPPFHIIAKQIMCTSIDVLNRTIEWRRKLATFFKLSVYNTILKPQNILMHSYTSNFAVAAAAATETSFHLMIIAAHLISFRFFFLFYSKCEFFETVAQYWKSWLSHRKN